MASSDRVHFIVSADPNECEGMTQTGDPDATWPTSIDLVARMIIGRLDQFLAAGTPTMTKVTASFDGGITLTYWVGYIHHDGTDYKADGTLADF